MGAPPRTLSVAIIAKNEAANLPRTLASVAAIATEVVLVDSGSSDQTVPIAASFGARILHREWLGFGPQKNYAIAHCTGDWILSLDADEELSPELTAAIAAVIRQAPADIAGYLLNRRNLFLGRWMRRGGYYPDPKLRLFRRGRAQFQERAVHESMTADGRTARLPGDLIHHTYPTLALYLEHMNRYSTSAAGLARGGAGRSLPAFLWNVVLNPLATFLYNYCLRGGFLDGREGLLLHLYHSCYVSWKYAKAWEQSRISR